MSPKDFEGFFAINFVYNKENFPLWWIGYTDNAEKNIKAIFFYGGKWHCDMGNGLSGVDLFGNYFSSKEQALVEFFEEHPDEQVYDESQNPNVIIKDEKYETERQEALHILEEMERIL